MIVSPAKMLNLWIMDLGGSKKPCIRWGSRFPVQRRNFEGKRGCPL